MSATPDLTLPVVGYRAWRLGDDGALAPVTMTRAIWTPGVNEARCLSRPFKPHEAPGQDCGCGIYALSWADDPRLDAETLAVGSVAAWGDMEVHSTGFRTRYACITALCRTDTAPPEHLAKLKAAAARYGVPLIDRTALSVVALEHAASVDFRRLWPGPRRAPTGTRTRAPSLTDDGIRGIALSEHVWVEIASGGLTLGITAALATAVQVGSPVALAELGAHRHGGERLATIGSMESELVISAPCDLVVERLNPALAGDPDLVRTDPESAGWLLWGTPPVSAWERQGGDLAWGDGARTIHAAIVADLARGGADPFAWQKAAWLARRPRVCNAAQVLQVLATERARPKFADEREVHQRIGGRVECALADPQVRRLAMRAQARIHLRLHHPDADLHIDLAGDSAATQPCDDITLFTDALTADRLLAGRLDVAQALRARRIQTRTPLSRVLSVMSLLKGLQAAYDRAT